MQIRMRLHERGPLQQPRFPPTPPPHASSPDTISVPQRRHFLFLRLLSVNSLFDEGPSRMHAITGSSSAELHVSRKRERDEEQSRVRSETMRRGSTISNSEVPSFFFLSLSPRSLPPFIFISRWNHGWMDGWMEKQRNRRDIPLFANSIDHDS